MGHSEESFNALIDEIMALGYDEATASKYARLIGDTPCADETGAIVVLDDDNKELARLKLKSFSGVPSTMEEAVDRVISALKPEELSQLISASKEDLPKFHFSLGLWIRNNFRLFDSDNSLIKDICSRNQGHSLFTDPDEISALIIEAVWTKLHKEG